MNVHKSAAEALFLVTQTKFKHFTELDWDAFSGCESENPLIGHNGDYTLILDGENLSLIHAEDEFGGQIFSLAEI